jgi:hypothetical protein
LRSRKNPSDATRSGRESSPERYGDGLEQYEDDGERVGIAVAEGAHGLEIQPAEIDECTNGQSQSEECVDRPGRHVAAGGGHGAMVSNVARSPYQPWGGERIIRKK